MEKDTSEYATSQEFTEEDPDLEVLENETVLENLRIAINLQVTAPQHPIVVRNRNLCELSKAKKLDVLKVAELRRNVRKSSIRGLWLTSEKEIIHRTLKFIR